MSCLKEHRGRTKRKAEIKILDSCDKIGLKRDGRGDFISPFRLFFIILNKTGIYMTVRSRLFSAEKEGAEVKQSETKIIS